MELLDNILKKSNERKLYHRIRDDHVLTGGYSADHFQANTSYFEIRLTEMYLHKREQIWRGFIPLGLAVTDFGYETSRQSVPFFVGNQIMKNIDQYIDGNYVDYRNTKVAGPFPYLGGDIGLFVGLFRLEVSNIIKGLLGVLDSLAASFNIAQLSSYLKIAGPLSEELLPLLGIHEVSQQIAIREELTGSRLQESYLIYGNTGDDDILKNSLWIDSEGRLMSGSGKANLKAIDRFDYVVIHIKRIEAREDLTLLPFHEPWQTTRQLLTQGKENEARNSFTETIRLLASSPDLTEEHRYELLLLYKTKYERERELLATVLSPAAPANRGLSDSKKQYYGFDITMQDTARIAKEEGFGEDIWDPIMALSRQWRDIPELAAPKAEEESQVILKQLDSIKKIMSGAKPDSAALAEALTLTTYRSG